MRFYLIEVEVDDHTITTKYLTLLSSSTSPVAATPVEKRAPDGPDLVSLSSWCWLGWADSFSVNFSMAGISIRLALNPIS